MYLLRWHYHIKDITGAPYKIKRKSKQKRRNSRQSVVAVRQQLYCAVQSRSPSHYQRTTGKVPSSAHDGTSSAMVHSCRLFHARAEATGKSRSALTFSVLFLYPAILSASKPAIEDSVGMGWEDQYLLEAAQKFRTADCCGANSPRLFWTKGRCRRFVPKSWISWHCLASWILPNFSSKPTSPHLRPCQKSLKKTEQMSWTATIFWWSIFCWCNLHL